MPPSADHPRLFLDRRLISASENVELTIAPCTRHPANPLTVDGRTIWTRKNLMVSVYRDTESGEYRGWRYENIPRPDAADGGPAFPIRSKDGLTWHTCGEPIRMGAVMYDETDPDPDRRFKMIHQGWAELDEAGRLKRTATKSQWAAEGGEENLGLTRGIFAACSPDGCAWPEHHVVVTEDIPPGQRWWTPGAPGWAGGDNFPCVIWSPELERYVAFYRTNIQRLRGSRRERGVGRSDSQDFREWGPHELVMHARTTWRKIMGYGAQDYYQLQVWRDGGVYLGIVSVFYWEEDRVRLELAWSPDTIHWERICPGMDLIPHGALGEPDGGCRYAAMRPITVGDEVRVYYGGDNGRHNADSEREATFNLAIFRRDRFAGLRAKGGAEGRVTTEPVTVAGSKLVLNVDAADGEVLVEL